MAVVKFVVAFAALNFLGANAGPCKPSLDSTLTLTTTSSASVSSTSNLFETTSDSIETSVTSSDSSTSSSQTASSIDASSTSDTTISNDGTTSSTVFTSGDSFTDTSASTTIPTTSTIDVSSSTASTSSSLSTCTVNALNKISNSGFEEDEGWNFSTNGDAAIEVQTLDEAHCGERAAVVRIWSNTGNARLEQTLWNLEENTEYLFSYYWAISTSQAIQPDDCFIEHYINGQTVRRNTLAATGPGFHQHRAAFTRTVSAPNPLLQLRLACRGAYDAKFYLDDFTVTPRAPRCVATQPPAQGKQCGTQKLTNAWATSDVIDDIGSFRVTLSFCAEECARLPDCVAIFSPRSDVILGTCGLLRGLKPSAEWVADSTPNGRYIFEKGCFNCIED